MRPVNAHLDVAVRWCIGRPVYLVDFRIHIAQICRFPWTVQLRLRPCTVDRCRHRRQTLPYVSEVDAFVSIVFVARLVTASGSVRVDV